MTFLERQTTYKNRDKSDDITVCALENMIYGNKYLCICFYFLAETENKQCSAVETKNNSHKNNNIKYVLGY